MKKGLIIKSLSGDYTVKTQEGLFVCKARGLFRKDGFSPLCGDEVEFEVTNLEKKEGYIYQVAKRKNSLVRPPVSNVDTLVITFSPLNPELDHMLIDYLILSAKMQDIKAVLCVNKIDLASKDLVEDIERQYAKSGCALVKTDALNNINVDDLSLHLAQGITVFAGQSGAGKSTLINSLTGKDVMETGSLSLKIQRGKNTTRHCELLPFIEGFIADTPGFSKFDPLTLDHSQIKDLYTEFEPYRGLCKFNDCLHLTEIDCAVIEAVEKKEIDIDRYSRYKIIYNIAKEAFENRRGY